MSPSTSRGRYRIENIAEAMLVQALPSRVERFIDLGTDDGRLIALVREHHPDARALGIGLDPY